MYVCKWSDNRTDLRLDVCICIWNNQRADRRLDNAHISNRQSVCVLLPLQRKTYLTFNLHACHFIYIHTHMQLSICTRVSSLTYTRISNRQCVRDASRLTVRYVCLCKCSNTRADQRLDMYVYVNEVKNAHIDDWICVYVHDVTHVQING
jgi:hypothetical protein